MLGNGMSGGDDDGTRIIMTPGRLMPPTTLATGPAPLPKVASCLTPQPHPKQPHPIFHKKRNDQRNKPHSNKPKHGPVIDPALSKKQRRKLRKQQQAADLQASRVGNSISHPDPRPAVSVPFSIPIPVFIPSPTASSSSFLEDAPFASPQHEHTIRIIRYHPNQLKSEPSSIANHIWAIRTAAAPSHGAHRKPGSVVATHPPPSYPHHHHHPMNSPANGPPVTDPISPVCIVYLWVKPLVLAGYVTEPLAIEHFSRPPIRPVSFAAFLSYISTCIRKVQAQSPYWIWKLLRNDLYHSDPTCMSSFFMRFYGNVIQGNRCLDASSTTRPCVAWPCPAPHFVIEPMDKVFAIRWSLRLIFREFPALDAALKRDLEHVVARMNNLKEYTSLIGQVASLLMLSKSDVFRDYVMLVLQKMVRGPCSSANQQRQTRADPLFNVPPARQDVVDAPLSAQANDAASAEPMESEAVLADLQSLDEFALLIASLKFDANAKLLTVSQYACSVGESYMSKCYLVWVKRISTLTQDGSLLPPPITREEYDEVVQSHVYTMPMHLWLFCTVSDDDFIAELEAVKAYGFSGSKSIVKNQATLRKWKAAALVAVHQKNESWIRRMKRPGAGEMLASCERLMPAWVEELGKCITHQVAPTTASTRPSQKAYERWGAQEALLEGLQGLSLGDQSEPVMPDSGSGERQLSDWRKITRFFRDYEIASLSIPPEKEWSDAPHPVTKRSGAFSYPMMRAPPPQALYPNGDPCHWECAAIMCYLFHASNQLKHTNYEHIDPELFLFLSHALFRMMRGRVQVSLTIWSGETQSLHRMENADHYRFTSSSPHPKRRDYIVQVQATSQASGVPAYTKLMNEIYAALPSQGSFFVKSLRVPGTFEPRRWSEEQITNDLPITPVELPLSEQMDPPTTDGMRQECRDKGDDEEEVVVDSLSIGSSSDGEERIRI